MLSPKEVSQLINAAGTPFRQTLLITFYGTGMRRAELAHLKVRDIDSQRMIIRVVAAKGGKDRDLPLKVPPDHRLLFGGNGWGDNLLFITASHNRDTTKTVRRPLMTENCEIWLATFSLGAFLCSSSVAQTTNSPVQKQPASVRELVVEYLAARNAKDLPRLKSLLHPKSLECITAENKDFYDDRTTLLLNEDRVPTNYELAITPFRAADELPWKGYLEFPVRPSHQIEIKYSLGEDDGMIVLAVMNESGRWYEVDSCATRETLKNYRDGEAARRAQTEKVKALVTAMKEPLRSELRALIREQKYQTARARYEQAAGQAPGIDGMLVIRELKAELKRNN